MAPLFPVPDPHLDGRPLKYDRRLVLDSIRYVLVSGCAWRLVPHDLAPWDVGHLLVDTLGPLLAAAVTTAGLQDRPGGRALPTAARPRHHAWPWCGPTAATPTSSIPARSTTPAMNWACSWRSSAAAMTRGCQVLPRRRVVERTFGWLTRSRRLARDYGPKTEHAEAMIKIAMIRPMAARLTAQARSALPNSGA